MDTPMDSAILALKLSNQRGSTVDPTKRIAVELQNITDVLLEILKALRVQGTQR